VTGVLMSEQAAVKLKHDDVFAYALRLVNKPAA
jgi:hypothetical protein